MSQFPLCLGNRIQRAFLVAWSVLWLCPFATPAEEDHTEFFEKSVRPVLVEQCYRCHSAGAEKLKGGLHLDSRAGVLKGGESGPVVVPGHPEQSRLVEAIHYTNVDLQMPPKGKLSEAQIADLETWIKMGLPWPGATDPGPGPSQRPAFDLQARRRQHWAWRPIQATVPPAVTNSAWVRNDVDRFILQRIEQSQLQPAPAADRRTWLRRVYFDLTGLPPAPAQVNAFLEDASPAADEKVVDQLLASSAFGERWARHWLDLVRYAETLGHEFDYPNPNAWRYRDYVIRAFNADVPYDQFVMEHLAGDLLPSPRRNPDNGANESVIGTTFYWLGQRDHSPVDVRQHQAELIDNQIDVLSKTFLGLTVACARCHDHKFDAISTLDYYSLYGFLSSSRYTQAAINPPEAVAEKRRQLLDLKQQLRQAIGSLWLTQTRQAAQCLLDQAGQLPSFANGLNSRKGDYVFADPTQTSASWAGWFCAGDAFTPTPARAGDFVVGSADAPVKRMLTSAAFDSGLLSRRFEGTLRSPTFIITNQFIHIRAAGHGARINVPVDNFTMIRDPIYGGLKRSVDSDQFRWITVDVGMWKGHRAYLEFSDVAVSDPADETHPGGYPRDGYLAVEGVLFSESPHPPSPVEQGNTPAVFTLAPSPQAGPSLAAGEGMVAQAVQKWLCQAPDLTPLEADLLAWLNQHDALNASRNPEIMRLLTAYHEVEASIPEAVRVPAMADGTGLDEHVFVRGSYKAPGPNAPRRFLEALAGTNQPPIQCGSGRIELARWLTNRSNPFLARVMVNRVWLHLFGRGLVPTPDDFGALGQPPSHPELLDWLAEWYRTEAHWSTRKLIRLLVTSSTYRMASHSEDPMAEEKDPENLLWHRMPIRRLEGEAIRDAMLAVSGALDPTLFGPPIPIHLTEFMEGRGRPGSSGPLDEAGRRSIYIEVRRNFVSPMMRAFDMPVPFTTVGRRTVSNVPAQSLILMNDPFVRAEAQRWAQNVLRRPDASPESRIEGLYETAFARPPSADERQQAVQFLQRQTAAYDSAEAGQPHEMAVWTDLCQVLFNVKEFIFLN